jgi:hypothetical protein
MCLVDFDALPLRKNEMTTNNEVRFVAFPASEYDEVLTTEMVFETLVCSPLNHLTRLIARESFITYQHYLI